MGEIFEKLLLVNDVLSQEELDFYKKMVTNDPKKKNLPQLLVERGLIQSDQVQKFLTAERENNSKEKWAKRQKLDQKLLHAVQDLQLISVSDFADCLREYKELWKSGRKISLRRMLIQKGFLTKYMVRKLARNASKIEHPEQEIFNIPQYLRDRFLGKIIIKNDILPSEQFQICWKILKQSWPCKGLAEIIMGRNLLSENKMKLLLQVLKQNLPQKYPHFASQIRDWEMARLLAQKNYLSPKRLNRCLAQQMTTLHKKEYLPLRKILVTEGYLTEYLFDVVLKSYGTLVTCDPPGFLVPNEDIHLFTRETVCNAIQDAKSDVHLIVSEEDIKDLQLNEEFLRQAEVSSEIVDLEYSVLEGTEEDIQEIQRATTDFSGKPDEIVFNDFDSSPEKVLTPDRIVLVEDDVEDDEEDFLDIDVEDEDLDIGLGMSPNQTERIEPAKMIEIADLEHEKMDPHEDDAILWPKNPPPKNDDNTKDPHS